MDTFFELPNGNLQLLTREWEKKKHFLCTLNDGIGENKSTTNQIICSGKTIFGLYFFNNHNVCCKCCDKTNSLRHPQPKIHDPVNPAF